MSMSSAQSDELRTLASELGQVARAYENCGDCGETSNLLNSSADIMREAADTIEELSAKLQGMVGTRWHELFGTPERAAQTLSGITCDAGRCDGCTLRSAICTYDENVTLEWLMGESDGE